MRSTRVQQHGIKATNESRLMSVIRVAGFVRPKESIEMQKIASVMEVASWIQRVSHNSS